MGEKATSQGATWPARTFRGLQGVPVKSTESFTRQLLQRAQRRHGSWAPLWKLQRRRSSGDPARA